MTRAVPATVASSVIAAITATTDADRRVTANPEKATSDAPVKAKRAHRVDQRHERIAAHGDEGRQDEGRDRQPGVERIGRPLRSGGAASRHRAARRR